MTDFSDQFPVTDLVHGMLFPAILHCEDTHCYLATTLAGIRIQDWRKVPLRPRPAADHSRILLHTQDKQRAWLIRVLGAGGCEVRFDTEGVLNVQPPRERLSA